jgi:hypothetical protein
MHFRELHGVIVERRRRRAEIAHRAAYPAAKIAPSCSDFRNSGDPSDNLGVPLSATMIPPTAASTRAARNWTANLRGLANLHPALAEPLQSLSVQGEWVLARDGSLTLRDEHGAWLADCSVPSLAAAAMLKSFDPRGTVACFLAPGHAAEIRAVLDRLSPQQAVLVLAPDLGRLRVQLACEDFSADLTARRLFFAAGESWATELLAIFEAHPGLPTPQQFIKLPTLAAEIGEPLVAEAQHVFAAVLASRADQIRESQRRVRLDSRPARRIGQVAGSRFQLWNDTGAALAEALRPVCGLKDAAASIHLHAARLAPATVVHVVTLDPDIPVEAGPLAAARFCEDIDVLVMPDAARCDQPDLLPRELPWVTWVTRGRIPLAAAAGPNDALLLADASWKPDAISAGWNAARIGVATFTAPAGEPTDGDVFEGWTAIADTLPIVMPKSLEEYSSHRLLWETIAAELQRDPMAIGHDTHAYLQRHAHRAGVDESTLDARLFGEMLIQPAYQQGLIRALKQAGVPVRAFGRGWDEIDEFQSLATGAITSRQQLGQVLATSRKLLHLWPTDRPHPIAATGLPVLTPSQPRLDVFVRQAQQPLPPFAGSIEGQPMSLDAIFSVLPADFRPIS